MNMTSLNSPRPTESTRLRSLAALALALLFACKTNNNGLQVFAASNADAAGAGEGQGGSDPHGGSSAKGDSGAAGAGGNNAVYMALDASVGVVGGGGEKNTQPVATGGMGAIDQSAQPVATGGTGAGGQRETSAVLFDAAIATGGAAQTGGAGGNAAGGNTGTATPDGAADAPLGTGGT